MRAVSSGVRRAGFNSCFHPPKRDFARSCNLPQTDDHGAGARASSPVDPSVTHPRRVAILAIQASWRTLSVTKGDGPVCRSRAVLDVDTRVQLLGPDPLGRQGARLDSGSTGGAGGPAPGGLRLSGCSAARPERPTGPASISAWAKPPVVFRCSVARGSKVHVKSRTARRARLAGRQTGLLFGVGGPGLPGAYPSAASLPSASDQKPAPTIGWRLRVCR